MTFRGTSRQPGYSKEPVPRTPGKHPRMLATPCHLDGSRRRVLPFLMGSLQVGFFLLERSECQEEYIHAQHRANYICSRKRGCHRSLDSPEEAAASGPILPPAPSICRWARQVVVLAESNTAALILEPSLREKLMPEKSGKAGATGARVTTLTGWHEPRALRELRVKQPPGEQGNVCC